MQLDTPIKNLLVDLDGTLLGNRNIPLGLDFTRKAFRALKPYGNWRKVSKTLFGIMQEFENDKGKLTNDGRVVKLFSERMGFPEEESRRILRESVFKVFPELKKHFYPIPGAKSFLLWAKRRYRLVLATNPVWPEEIIKLRIEWAGIDPGLFESITHAHRMHACKPKPRYFREILEQEKLEASQTLLIGDNTNMDLPATKVGIPVFIVGDYQRLTRLNPSYAKAQAFRGTYGDLRELLG